MSYNPFAEFAKFAQFDPSQFDFSKLLGQVKVPGFDVEAALASQRKNLEALAQANQLAFGGMQALAKRQGEILAQAVAETNALAQELAKAGTSPQELSARQAKLTQEAFEKAFANMRELAELVSKSNAEVYALVNQRVNESLEELKALVAKK